MKRAEGQSFLEYTLARAAANAIKLVPTMLYANIEHSVKTPDGIKGVPYVKADNLGNLIGTTYHTSHMKRRLTREGVSA